MRFIRSYRREDGTNPAEDRFDQFMDRDYKSYLASNSQGALKMSAWMEITAGAASKLRREQAQAMLDLGFTDTPSRQRSEERER